jgi:hypothetical protein
MIIIITMSEKISHVSYLSSVSSIDLVVFMVLIGLLTFKEFLSIYLVQSAISQPYTKGNMGRLIDISMIPLLYIFIFVVIYKIFNTLYST